MTWSDTDTGRACHEMLPWPHSGQYSSFGVAWNELRPEILNASYYPATLTGIPRFREWVDDLFHFYTLERLRRSQAHPPPSESMRQIMDLIRWRLDDPTANEPVRIVVMGGSVTAGRDCDVNMLDLPGTNNRGDAPRWCAYPARLERLLNHVLFTSGRRQSQQYRDEFPVFEVRNLAVQATNSAVGAVSLEYKFISSLEDEPPHIVLASYSANDGHDEEAQTFQVDQQQFVRAAHNLRPCDDHLPLIVLSDDRYGHGVMLTNALVNTGSIYKTASWYNLMAVMYTNVARHHADWTADFNGSHPLFGSTRMELTHLGMGFHIGQAWTLFYNLLSAMHDTCSDPVSSDGALTEKNRTWTFEEPPTKYRGGYAWSGTGVQQEWVARMERKARSCPLPPAPAAEDRPLYSTGTCPYAWMVDPMANISTTGALMQAMKHVMISNVGWGALQRYLKPVWYSNSSLRASFTLELRNVTMNVDSFMMLSTKSFMPQFNGSKVSVTIDVIPSFSAASPDEDNRSNATGRWHVVGFHDKPTTVAYPTKLKLPNGGAKAGDTIRATITSLQPNTAFMISGLALCDSSRGTGR